MSLLELELKKVSHLDFDESTQTAINEYNKYDSKVISFEITEKPHPKKKRWVVKYQLDRGTGFKPKFEITFYEEDGLLTNDEY